MTIKLSYRESQVYSLIAPATIDRPIPASEIRQVIGYEPHETRSIVHSLRRKTIPICANQYGYYIAQDKSELIVYLRQLNGRIQEQLSVHTQLATIDDVHDHIQEIQFDKNYKKMSDYVQLSLLPKEKY